LYNLGHRSSKQAQAAEKARRGSQVSIRQFYQTCISSASRKKRGSSCREKHGRKDVSPTDAAFIARFKLLEKQETPLICKLAVWHNIIGMMMCPVEADHFRHSGRPSLATRRHQTGSKIICRSICVTPKCHAALLFVATRRAIKNSHP